MSNFKDMWFQCEIIIHSQVTLKEKMQAICNFLGSQVPAYDWVGFYLSDVKNKKLHLGPFYGEPTEHTSISYGKGVCGQAAEAQKTFVIDDVAEEKNYIACDTVIPASLKTLVKEIPYKITPLPNLEDGKSVDLINDLLKQAKLENLYNDNF